MKPRLITLMRSGLTYGLIVVGTLALFDLACITLGLFPPRPQFGDPEMGWRPAPATGRFGRDRCRDITTGHVIEYQRNEDGIRTGVSAKDRDHGGRELRIGVTGDSYTDLCATDGETHHGVLEAELRAVGFNAVTLTYAAGRYSPLQEYLAFRAVLKPYRPQVLVMNIYTGNDFHDMLRTDDRPHLERTAAGYRIAKPSWLVLEDPTIRRRSRVLYAIKTFADKTGMRRLYLRAVELRQLAGEQGKGMVEVAEYMRDLWRANAPSVGYPAAFTAQMLNQQLFFHHFPGSRAESLRRTQSLLQTIREENPGMLLVLSAFPSYELTTGHGVDSVLVHTLSRLPVNLEGGIKEEQGLYSALQAFAGELGWTFVDNLQVLQGYRGKERLYNSFDYHMTPAASLLIGHAQAQAVASVCGRPSARASGTGSVPSCGSTSR